MSDKRAYGGGGGGGGGFLEKLPNSILHELLLKVDLDTLCSAACVSKTLRFAVSQVLSSLSSLDLSAFSPDVQTLNHILHRFRGLKTVTLDCLRLDDSSISRLLNLLGAHVQELTLLKCSSLSYGVLASIGQSCPNLRVLAVELASWDLLKIFRGDLVPMLGGCSYLESLCIKIRATEFYPNGLQYIQHFLPKTVKVLKLQPVLERDVVHFIHELGVDHELGVVRSFLETSPNFRLPFPGSPGFALRYLSLVLDIISDELIISIANTLSLLAELDLEDRPSKEPFLPYDLTNSGLQSLGSCQQLTSLSLIRSRQNHPVSFKRINDMGMFLLAEGCGGLESVRLGGFSKVSDAGFAAILHSCQNLKHFEVHNASLLSDLAFHDMIGAPCSLVEVRLLSCSLITSETVTGLASCSGLEMLDLCGCRSVADACLSSVSCLHNLNMLNLGGADITDNGLAVIGNLSITRLCLRGCKRVTDKGIARMLCGGGTMSKTLSALDVGSMPGISDKTILTIAEVALGITELCIRYCFHVTDASMKILASWRSSQDTSKLLRRLDLFHCNGLSIESLGLLKKPSFCGLQWIGFGRTRLTSKPDVLAEIREERPWLTVCVDGCEVGCHDGWQFHNSDKNLT
ncbi:F-box protein At-B [Cornus florida]|uniref:F-box protein At-B n=1 Tax=Cornus florida TaxID=4283 RepID=UPI0028979F0D|nr:F-box protein At-B [Cornus florida]